MCALRAPSRASITRGPSFVRFNTKETGGQPMPPSPEGHHQANSRGSQPVRSILAHSSSRFSATEKSPQKGSDALSRLQGMLGRSREAKGGNNGGGGGAGKAEASPSLDKLRTSLSRTLTGRLTTPVSPTATSRDESPSRPLLPLTSAPVSPNSRSFAPQAAKGGQSRLLQPLPLPPFFSPFDDNCQMLRDKIEGLLALGHDVLRAPVVALKFAPTPLPTQRPAGAGGSGGALERLSSRIGASMPVSPNAGWSVSPPPPRSKVGAADALQQSFSSLPASPMHSSRPVSPNAGGDRPSLLPQPSRGGGPVSGQSILDDITSSLRRSGSRMGKGGGGGGESEAARPVRSQKTQELFKTLGLPPKSPTRPSPSPARAKGRGGDEGGSKLGGSRSFVDIEARLKAREERQRGVKGREEDDEGLEGGPQPGDIQPEDGTSVGRGVTRLESRLESLRRSRSRVKDESGPAGDQGGPSPSPSRPMSRVERLRSKGSSLQLSTLTPSKQGSSSSFQTPADKDRSSVSRRPAGTEDTMLGDALSPLGQGEAYKRVSAVFSKHLSRESLFMKQLSYSSSSADPSPMSQLTGGGSPTRAGGTGA
ncbi:unnamed protein product [Vitrella brassicaformis CCMP3155]|uniref:Uncharacterized protein n=2 Tax=Vitrella brassicaformis TaxID=1169539 RepID=A0A0G4F3F1_VITBC|nr:unnamed protein product [Vitrella brassicaformis CCMP3155]|mmetsp:Transcript_38928/g.97352  ORF Transcript_38928/g.97352 Transcript_38928/m.97352 type:complete len:593 (+) Transcript_38928:126-1904(+)|eukprot:CEM06719.1 unnamed protein product [Vitrella brassicaformis CCMP3155]